MKKTLMIMMLIAVAGFSTANAQTPKVILNDKTGWHRIGEVTVNFQKDRDQIVVLGEDRFASIKFKVEDAPVEIISLDIYYESGDTQHVNVNTQVAVNGESKIIDLHGGNERRLKKIVFIYKTLPNHKDEKAHVEVWGLKTNAAKE